MPLRRKMELVQQPKGSSLCGQACVATIAGVDLDTSVAKAFGGKKGRTTARDLQHALDYFGLVGNVPLELNKTKQWSDLPRLGTSIIRCRQGKTSHYIVQTHGAGTTFWYDPEADERQSGDVPWFIARFGFKPTSYMRVRAPIQSKQFGPLLAQVEIGAREPVWANHHRDEKGREIMPGDLVRAFHYRAAQRRRKQYLYHVAVVREGFMLMIPASQLEPSKAAIGGGSYMLTADMAARCEIISGLNKVGDDLIQYHERPRLVG